MRSTNPHPRFWHKTAQQFAEVPDARNSAKPNCPASGHTHPNREMKSLVLVIRVRKCQKDPEGRLLHGERAE